MAPSCRGKRGIQFHTRTNMKHELNIIKKALDADMARATTTDEKRPIMRALAQLEGLVDYFTARDPYEAEQADDESDGDLNKACDAETYRHA